MPFKMWKIFASLALALSLRCYITQAEITTEEMLGIQRTLISLQIAAAKEFGLTAQHIKEIQEKGNDVDFYPCYLKVYYKKVHYIGDNGLVNTTKPEIFVRNHIKDGATVDLIIGILHDCGEIHDKNVKDGDEECAAVKKLAECFYEHKDSVELLLLPDLSLFKRLKF